MFSYFYWIWWGGKSAHPLSKLKWDNKKVLDQACKVFIPDSGLLGVFILMKCCLKCIPRSCSCIASICLFSILGYTHSLPQSSTNIASFTRITWSQCNTLFQITLYQLAQQDCQWLSPTPTPCKHNNYQNYIVIYLLNKQYIWKEVVWHEKTQMLAETVVTLPCFQAQLLAF